MKVGPSAAAIRPCRGFLLAGAEGPTWPAANQRPRHGRPQPGMNVTRVFGIPDANQAGRAAWTTGRRGDEPGGASDAVTSLPARFRLDTKSICKLMNERKGVLNNTDTWNSGIRGCWFSNK